MNRRINIFLVPASNRNNKYIDLFTSSLKAANENVRIYSLKGEKIMRIFPYLFSADFKSSINVIHIHWPTVLYGSKFILKSLFLLVNNFLLLCIFKYIFKMKIVWTVHNFFSHDYPHLYIDKTGQSMICFLADLVIVQQKVTYQDFSSVYPNKNIQYIPHGNYIGAYGKIVPQDISFRRSFGFLDDDIVLLTLGVIAPYKLIEKVIDSIDPASRIKLLICGKGKKEYILSLKKYAESNKNIIIQEGFVSDIEIPRYFSIADYSVFYYDKSEMTSGGIILSLSYGVPVITRDIPMSEIVSSKNGFVFRDEKSLKETFGIIIQNNKSNKDDVVDSIRKYDFLDLAKKLVSLYEKLK